MSDHNGSETSTKLDYMTTLRLNSHMAAKFRRLPENKGRNLAESIRSLIEERTTTGKQTQDLTQHLNLQDRQLTQLKNRTDEIAESLYLFMFLFWKTSHYDTQNPNDPERGEHAMRQWRHFLDSLRTNLSNPEPLLQEVQNAAAESGYDGESSPSRTTTEEDLEQNR